MEQQSIKAASMIILHIRMNGKSLVEIICSVVYCGVCSLQVENSTFTSEVGQSVYHDICCYPVFGRVGFRQNGKAHRLCCEVMKRSCW